MESVIGQAWSRMYGTMDVSSITVCQHSKAFMISGDVVPDHSDETTFKTLYVKDFQWFDSKLEDAFKKLLVDEPINSNDLPF